MADSPTAVSEKHLRSVLVESLPPRAQEIQQAIFERLLDATPDALDDVQYSAALKSTVAAMVEYTLRAIEDGDEPTIPIPSLVIEQARRAARAGVGLRAVTRRYMAGHAVLQRFILEEAGEGAGEALGSIMSSLARHLERVMDVAESAYEEECQRLQRSPEHRRAHRIERVLAGEAVQLGDVRYEFEKSWHICVIAVGSQAQAAIALLAAKLDRQQLTLPREENTVCVWFAGPARIASRDVEQALKDRPLNDAQLAIGEPELGLRGWRETHRQAQEALLVAQRLASIPLAACGSWTPGAITRYFDVGLDALALLDERRARQLLDVYLGGLCGEDADSASLRQTLRSYLANGHIADKAAAKLHINRKTVRYRLTKAAERLGYDIETRPAELTIALRIFALLEGRE